MPKFYMTIAQKIFLDFFWGGGVEGGGGKCLLTVSYTYGEQCIGNNVQYICVC